MRPTLRAVTGALALAAAVAAPRAGQAQQALKIGHVDVAVVMEQIPGRQQVEQDLEREVGGIQNELQRMNDSLQLLVTNFQRQQATLTAAQRTAREQEFQRKQQEFQQRAQQLNQRGQARTQEVQGQMESLVREAINDVRTTGGYSLIFAAGANSALLSADRALDVTDQVLARMRTIAAARPLSARTAAGAQGAQAPATAPAAAPAAGPVAAPAGAARPGQRPN